MPTRHCRRGGFFYEGKVMNVFSVLAGLGHVFKSNTPSEKHILNQIADAVDMLYKDDGEQLDRHAALARVISKGDALQAKINLTEASRKNILVAGWRPFIGWICGFALGWHFLLLPMLDFGLRSLGVDVQPISPFDLGELNTILFGMLGLGTLRTAEKAVGRA